jgi:hypothetical protein
MPALRKDRAWPAALAIAALGLGAPEAPPRPADSAAAATDHPKDFAPGVRINWHRGEIELDAVVVLREGPLELLACSPHTREHESILAVKARPMHVFQAMGLLGWQPGSPVRYEDKSDHWLAPTGQALELRVRYLDGGVERTVPVEQWLMDVKQHRVPDSLQWVFAGSRTLPDGRFGADVDGTVVCVVDFETALITLPALHSADNDLLWLTANTEAIPPLGTTCTLLIRSGAGRKIPVEVAVDGSLRRAGGAVSVEELAGEARHATGDAPQVRIVLTAREGASRAKVDSVIETLVRAGIKRESIDVRSEPQKGEPPHPPE